MENWFFESEFKMGFEYISRVNWNLTIKFDVIMSTFKEYVFR